MELEMDAFSDSRTLEFHYIFAEDDKSHSLNAYIRNNCEKEFLAIIKTLSTELGVHTNVNVESKKDGSLIDVYNFIVSQNGLAIAVWATFFLEIIKYAFPRKTNMEREGLDIENERGLLELIKKAKELEEQGVILPPKIEKRLRNIYLNQKVKKKKSNFFKNLQKEQKIKSLEVSSVDINDKTKKQVLFLIPREDFESYLLHSDDLESEIDNKAVVEVISPVLKNGKYMWRGIYRRENLTHEFVMVDKDFKKTVIEDGISFRNGTELECEVEICKKLNDDGDVFNAKYKINKVYDHRIGENITEMPSGKKRREKQMLKRQQPSLFDDLEDDSKTT